MTIAFLFRVFTGGLGLVFFAAASFAETDINSADPRDLLEANTDLFGTETKLDIQSALSQWGHSEVRNIALTAAISREGIPEASDESTYLYALETQTSNARLLYKNYIESLSQTLRKITSDLRTHPKDLLTVLDHNLSININPMLLKADTLSLKALGSIARFIENASPEDILRFKEIRPALLMAYRYFLDSKVERLDSALRWAHELILLSQQLTSGQSDSENLKLKSQRWSKHIQREADLKVRHAWVNLETISAVTIAAVASAQTVCIVVSVGICAATLPATAEWYIVGSRFALSAARAGIATKSALDIIDRYRLNGSAGLVNAATAIDIAIILLAMPSAGLKGLESTRTFTFLGQTVKASDIALHWNLTQIGTAKVLAIGGTTYGAWQIARAESIAKTLQKNSASAISEADIRRQGAINIMISLMGGIQGFQKHRFQMESSKSYQQYMNNRAGFIEQHIESIKFMSPFRSIDKIIRGVKEMPNNLWLGAKTTGFGVGHLSYQLIASGALALLSYTYPDFVMRRHQKSLPELKPGESALLVNGFASNDMLYYAFSSEYANRYEIEKYNSGDQKKLGGVFFESADDFFDQIDKYAQQHGKIRYLKIMAHGVPGKIVPLATRDIMDGTSRDLLDISYLEANRNRIQEIALRSIAPEAQIVIISCLVGGNLKNHTTYKGITFDSKAGDQFIEALGENLLINNGSIDSSRRIIMGLDGTVSPAFHHFVYSGIRNQRDRYHFETQVSNLIRDQQNSLKQSIFENQDRVDYSSIAQGLGERMISMYSHIWALAYKFGFNGEGGFFSERHRYDEFVHGKRRAEIKESSASN